MPDPNVMYSHEFANHLSRDNWWKREMRPLIETSSRNSPGLYYLKDGRVATCFMLKVEIYHRTENSVRWEGHLKEVNGTLHEVGFFADKDASYEDLVEAAADITDFTEMPEFMPTVEVWAVEEVTCQCEHTHHWAANRAQHLYGSKLPPQFIAGDIVPAITICKPCAQTCHKAAE